MRQNCSAQKIRWSLAAHDICFTNKVHTSFFMTGMDGIKLLMSILILMFELIDSNQSIKHTKKKKKHYF